MKFNRICYFGVLFLFLGSCAIQVAPGGGPKDINPPQLISSQPENFSNYFQGNNIRLNFDEFITLNDISSQLIVSPPLKYIPEIKIRDKSLLIHIRDTLIENTTYTINFGQGISDNNEGNKLENFQYVFSTGPIVDSMKIQGKIENAFDRKPEKGVLALVYRDTFDSLPYLERPLYFSKSNDAGEFLINNISHGFYKLIALKEKDANYLYLHGEELIGFQDSLIHANSENINIRIFKEIPDLRFLRAYSEFPGKAVVVFNSPADTIKLKWLTDTTGLEVYSINFSKNNDTLSIWYKNTSSDTLSFQFDHITLKDTVTIRLFKNTEEIKGRKKISASIISLNPEATLQHLFLPFYLQCNRPMAFADFDKIIFLEDSFIVKPHFKFTDNLRMQLNLEFKWKSNSKYFLFIPPGTFTDIFGIKNDSLQFTFITHGEEDYGSLKINFQRSGDYPYILQLVNESGSDIYREVKCNTDSTIELSYLDPRVYKIKLIKDSNGNGKWDTGNYLIHIQPEEIEFYPEGITIRANWDVEIDIRALSTGIKK